MLLGLVSSFVDTAVISDFCYLVLVVFVFAIVDSEDSAFVVPVCYLVALSDSLSSFPVFIVLISLAICPSLDHVLIALSR